MLLMFLIMSFLMQKAAPPFPNLIKEEDKVGLKLRNTHYNP